MRCKLAYIPVRFYHKTSILTTYINVLIHCLQYLKNPILQKHSFVLEILYEGCSNMNASSFITFFTYMLRQNAIPFWQELFVAFQMAPNIKIHSLYFSSYRRLYKGHLCTLNFFSEANCNTRFGTCADIVSYLCKLKTKWHQVLDASNNEHHYII